MEGVGPRIPLVIVLIPRIVVHISQCRLRPACLDHDLGGSLIPPEGEGDDAEVGNHRRLKWVEIDCGDVTPIGNVRVGHLCAHAVE